jgi:hypothetical protein
MPTESEMEALRQSLIARAANIEQQDLIVAQRRQDLIEQEVTLDEIDAALLVPIINNAAYTNADQRRVAHIQARANSTQHGTAWTQRNNLELQKRTAQAEASQQRRIYRPDELMMLYFANSTNAPVTEPPPPPPPPPPSKIDLKIDVGIASGAPSGWLNDTYLVSFDGVGNGNFLLPGLSDDPPQTVVNSFRYSVTTLGYDITGLTTGTNYKIIMWSTNADINLEWNRNREYHIDANGVRLQANYIPYVVGDASNLIKRKEFTVAAVNNQIQLRLITVVTDVNLVALQITEV